MEEEKQLFVVGDNRFHQISVAFLPENHQEVIADETEDAKIQWSHENTPEEYHQEFIPVPWKPPVAVREIACAAHWTGLVLRDGAVYEFGTLLGTPRPYPTRVVFPDSKQPCVEQLCCGRRFALCLTEEANVYAWGYNGFGQFGNGNFEHSESPILVQSLRPGQSTVRRLGAGANHAGAIVEVKRPEILGKGASHASSISVYTWGANRYAQCGPPACRHRPKPLKVMGIPNKASTPKKFAAGRHHSMVLTDDGELWTWGANSGGRLGRSGLEYPYTSSPGKVATEASGCGEHFEDVSCGHFHTTARTSTGDIYCWGVSSQGQCGTYGKQGAPVRLPQKIAVSEDWTVSNNSINVISGTNHSFCVDNFGSRGLWTWGDSLGGVGVSRTTSKYTMDEMAHFEPLQCNVREKQTAAEGNISIENIAAGSGHSVLLCSTN